MTAAIPEAPVPLTTTPAPPLRLLFWESTAGCNLECVHCRRLDVSQALSKNDLSTEQARKMILDLPSLGRPVLVFSGGEPLMRPDLFELAAVATGAGLPVALATNGTMIDQAMAKRIAAVPFHRVSISFDGPNAASHDGFRGVAGAFEASWAGFARLREQGVSMQINTTLARHNYADLERMYTMALEMGADAFHLFMLVPVGCGLTLTDNVRLRPEEYEAALEYVYDKSVEGRIHLKATCAPHYFRVARQQAKAQGHTMAAAPQHGGGARPDHPGGHPGGHPGAQPGGQTPPNHSAMTASTKGCLAGQAVCFVSHTGEVFPCGYLPVTSGNVKDSSLPQIWRQSAIFAQLRDDSQLTGKCGLCEYKKVCMGCRARAFAQHHDYLAEEPNCAYVPLRMRR